MSKDKIFEEMYNDAPQKGNTIKNTIALKRNVYAIILSVIFIVAVVLINVFSIVMAERYPLELDLTADKKHSMTEENINFVKGVEKEVNIYVCLTEEDYMCETNSEDNMCYLAANNYLVDFNSGNVPYYVQTVEILKKYARYNDNLTLKFLDMKAPESADITDNFEGFDFAKGDILVESVSIGADGKETARRTVIGFDEIYSYSDESANMVKQWEPYIMIYGNYALYGQGAGYAISGNDIEKALSAAIYKVISPETPKYLVPTTYYPVVNNTAIIIDEYLKETLSINNYELDYAEGMIAHILTEENFDEYEGIILAGCQRDISPADYETISKFLDNSGKRGKSFFYFAGIDVASKMPQLSVLLGDWGISFKDGILYETSKSYRVITDDSGDPTDFLHVSTGSELMANTYEGAVFVAGNTAPMQVVYPKNVTATYVRTTNVLMRTGSYGMTTIMPSNQSPKEWTPAQDAEYDAFPTIIMTTDEMRQEDHSVNVSYVVAFASTEFISNEWISQYKIPNDDFTLDIFNITSGLTENPFNFATKVITDPVFTPASETDQMTVKIIFMAVVPIAIFATGMTVWIVRKRK